VAVVGEADARLEMWKPLVVLERRDLALMMQPVPERAERLTVGTVELAGRLQLIIRTVVLEEAVVEASRRVLEMVAMVE
jgi:hypothetical protein